MEVIAEFTKTWGWQILYYNQRVGEGQVHSYIALFRDAHKQKLKGIRQEAREKQGRKARWPQNTLILHYTSMISLLPGISDSQAFKELHNLLDHTLKCITMVAGLPWQQVQLHSTIHSKYITV